MTLQQEIIRALGAKPHINPEEEIRRSVDFLKAYLKTYPFLKSLVLGISGGQDSTLAGKLSQMAIAELREETGDNALQFIAVRLPYGVQADEQDCRTPSLLFSRTEYSPSILKAPSSPANRRCAKRELS